MVLVMAVAWVLGSLLVGAREPTWRVLVVAVQAVVVALVAGVALGGGHRCWPARDRWPSSASPSRAATAPSWGDVIRFAVGPAARSPIAWLLVAGAVLPLVIARGTRLAWAARLWVLALASWGIAYAASHGDLGSFTPSETVVLAPAAFAVAVCIGIGIAAFENDLSRREFGWRQLVSASALVFVASACFRSWGARSAAAGISPRRGWNSRWPSWPGPVRASRASCGSAIPRALPAGGWSVDAGLAYALTPGRAA